MIKVYVVTQGEYSDYRIEAVFSTEEKALGFIKKLKLRGADVEEYVLDMKYDIPIGKKPYFLRMTKEGKAYDISVETIDSVRDYTQHANTEYGFTYDKYDLYINCFARDEEEAIKIANEKRVQLIASNRWRREMEK